MNQAAQRCTFYFQRLFRKMHGTVLFVRIIPTVILSLACVLLLFLALVFGLHLSLVLRYLLEACLVGMCCIVSSYLLWVKIVENPTQNLKKIFAYLLISECALPCLSVLLMALFLHWSFSFFVLFPLAFGWALFSGRFDQVMRLILIGIQFFLLALAAVLSFAALYTELQSCGGFSAPFAILLCCGLYFVYNLRFIFLLCRESAPYANVDAFPPYMIDEEIICVPDDVFCEEDTQSAWEFSVPPECLLDEEDFLYGEEEECVQFEREPSVDKSLPLDKTANTAPPREAEQTTPLPEQPDADADMASALKDEIFSGETTETEEKAPNENPEPPEEKTSDDPAPDSIL